MWSITNHTPFKAGKTWGWDKDGVHEWIVVVKAPYAILSNCCVELADEQLGTVLAPEYNDDHALTSLRYDEDLLSRNPAMNVLVNGAADATKGRPSTDIRVEARIARITKGFRIKGNSVWYIGPFGLSLNMLTSS